MGGYLAKRRKAEKNLKARVAHYNKMDNVVRVTKWSRGFHKPGSMQGKA